MPRRLLALLACALAVALAAPAAASAASPSLQEARHELATARALVARAVEAAEAGDRDRGYELARTAYLDHFEVVEIPLRLRSANLVLDAEYQFAQLRDGIRDGAPLSRVSDTAAILRRQLHQAAVALADKGLAAPAIAFGFSFSILFREGVEAVLLLAVLLGSLAAGSASNYRRPLGVGVLGALVATGVLWVLATVVIDVAPVQREWLEAITALLAVVVLIGVSFWIVARLDQRRRQEFMRARVAGAIAAGSAVAFAGLGFTAVFREGFETVLFYQALSLYAQGLGVWIAAGAGAAALALGAVAYAIIGLGRRLPLKPMLIGGAAVLLLLAVAFAGNAVRSLQEGDQLPVTPVASGIVRLPVLLAELTGVHPTVQGLAVQGAMLVVFVAGALYTFAWQPRRARRAQAAAA